MKSLMSLLILAFSLSVAQSRAEEVFSIQWEAASAAKPWLRQVEVVPSGELKAVVEQLPPEGPMKAGVRIRVYGKLTAVKLNGNPAALVAGDTVVLPVGADRVNIEATVAR